MGAVAVTIARRAMVLFLDRGSSLVAMTSVVVSIVAMSVVVMRRDCACVHDRHDGKNKGEQRQEST